MAEDADAYGGLPGAFPYAIRASDSWIFRSYVVFGALAAALVALLFALGTVGLIAATVGGEGSFSFSRAFYIVVGTTVVAPLLAPVLFVARRHRRASGSVTYDAALGTLGYGFVGSLYVGLVISTPDAFQEAAGPVVSALYALPAPVGVLPPLAVAVAIVLVGRYV